MEFFLLVLVWTLPLIYQKKEKSNMQDNNEKLQELLKQLAKVQAKEKAIQTEIRNIYKATGIKL
jgi:hypothetical protein